MPRKHISGRTPRKPNAKPSFDYKSDDFISRVYALAYEGFYNTEIAEEMEISRYEFEMAISKSKRLRNTLEEARAHANEQGAEMPSPAKFEKVWKESKGRRSVLIRKFNVGYQTFKEWLKKDPRLIDIMSNSELEFLEKLDARGKIVAAGMTVSEEEGFEGWSSFPDTHMMRFYFNTMGRRYGYGENPVEESQDADNIPKDVKQGVDIEKWIDGIVTGGGEDAVE